MARKTNLDGLVKVKIALLTKKQGVSIKVSLNGTYAYMGRILPSSWQQKTDITGSAYFDLPPTDGLVSLDQSQTKKAPGYKAESAEFYPFVFRVPKNMDEFTVGER